MTKEAEGQRAAPIFIDDPHAREIYCIDAGGFAISAGVVTATLMSHAWDHSVEPSVMRRVVVARLTMPGAGAHVFASQLFDFCEKHGITNVTPEQKERPQ